MPENAHISQEQLQTLLKVSREINSHLNLQHVLDRIIDNAIRTLQAEKGLILLQDTHSKELVPRSARAMDAQTISDVTAVSRSIIARVGTQGHPVILQDAPSELARGTTSMSLHGIVSVLCVPLRIRDRLVGAVYLDTTSPTTRFRQDDLPFMETFANLAAVAIENAKAHEAVQAVNENLERLVAERTAELAERNDDLAQAYQDLKNAQVQLIRAEKKASLGRLVAGVVHEINTPLGALRSNAGTLAKGLEKISAVLADDWNPNTATDLRRIAGTLHDVANISASASGKIAGVLKALRSFARLDEGEVKTVDLHEGLNATVDLLQSNYGDRISIQRLFGEMPPITCRAAEINQVFMNVIVNACESISGTGTVIVATRTHDDIAFIEIRDSGSGIPTDALPHVFDPGFTTKGVKVGTGLGLPIAHSILIDHGGQIEIASTEGQGTTVTVSLPVAAANQAHQASG